MSKLLKSRIFIFILDGIVCSSITATAYTISAKQIGYTPIDSSWKVSNVADAITDLYSNAEMTGLGTKDEPYVITY